MKGISYFRDNRNRVKAVLIDFKMFEKYEQEIEDFLEGIQASARKGEPTSSLNEVKKRLKKKGKL